MPSPQELEAAWRACAATICNEMCDGTDPCCSCRMAVKEALEAAEEVRAEERQKEIAEFTDEDIADMERQNNQR